MTKEKNVKSAKVKLTREERELKKVASASERGVEVAARDTFNYVFDAGRPAMPGFTKVQMFGKFEYANKVRDLEVQRRIATEDLISTLDHKYGKCLRAYRRVAKLAKESLRELKQLNSRSAYYKRTGQEVPDNTEVRSEFTRLKAIAKTRYTALKAVSKAAYDKLNERRGADSP